MFGYIYKTVNLITGKIYIGKHQYKGPDIDKGYLGSGKILKSAIQKYGRDNFKSYILEKCDSLQMLNEREKYWIRYFDNGCDLYNITQGGDGGPILDSLPLEQKKNAILKRSKTWRNNGYSQRMSLKRKEYYKQHPEKKTQISKGLKKYYSDNPQAASEATKRILAQRNNPLFIANSKKRATGERAGNSRACICIETQEKFVSATDAAQKYGGSYKIIWKCCKKQCATAAGYHWAFLEDIEHQKTLSVFIGGERKIFRNSKYGYKSV